MRQKNRHFVMLADTYDKRKHHVGGYWYSEKLDGFRGFWDGGITIGKPITEIPFANIDKKENRKKVPISTGLWSRYANVIHAPAWFTADLPRNVCLDGELYAGRGRFQFARSVCSNYDPEDAGWKQIQFVVFDAPPYKTWLMNGRSNDTNYKKVFDSFLSIAPQERNTDRDLETTYGLLNRVMPKNAPHILIHEQQRLPYRSVDFDAKIENKLYEITEGGGEGLILRNPGSAWLPYREPTILKVKGFEDAEGTVVGYVSGRETDLGSKLLGRIGNVVVQFGAVQFEVCGFNNRENNFSTDVATTYACENPGRLMPEWVKSSTFPRGSRITFRYRELTLDGIPKEARYYRKDE